MIIESFLVECDSRDIRYSCFATITLKLCNTICVDIIFSRLYSSTSLNTSWASWLCPRFLLPALSLSLFVCLSISLSLYLSVCLSPYISHRGQLISCWTLTFIQKDVFSIQHANLRKVTLAQVICANMNVTMVQEEALRLPSENNTLMDCANANMLDVSLFLS
jgi:hypothetical protein